MEEINMVKRKKGKGKVIDSTPNPPVQTETSISKTGLDDGLESVAFQGKTVKHAALNPASDDKKAVTTDTASSVKAGLEWDSSQAAKEAARLNQSVQKQPEFKQAKASEVVDQLTRGHRDPFIDESLKDVLTEGLFLQRKKHLLVPVNVQAYVVPRNSEATLIVPGQLKDQKSKKGESSEVETTSFHAPLGLDFRPLDEEEETLVWRIPNAFTRELNGTKGGGLPPGIHLYWTLPKALLEGRAKEVEDPLKNFEYLQTDGFVPETFNSTDPRFEHPISFTDAIKHRVEFTTEEEDTDSELSDSLEFPYLPDYWIVIRRSTPRPPTIAGSLRSWMIDAVTKEVTQLSSFEPSSRASNIPELTAIGPNTGDVHWMATYENVAGRFGFHDLPEVDENGPFDYMVCGWYSDETLDPAYMDATASEIAWFEHIEQVLRWSVNRNNVDNDADVSHVVYNQYFKDKVVKSNEKKA